MLPGCIIVIMCFQLTMERRSCVVQVEDVILQQASRDCYAVEAGKHIRLWRRMPGARISHSVMLKQDWCWEAV